MPEPSGLELLVEFSSDRVLLLHSAPVPHVPSLWLRRPVLSEETVDRFRPGDAEVVLELLDVDGIAVESFGWSAKGRRYDDWLQRSGQTPRRARSHQERPHDGGDSKRPVLWGGPHELSPGEGDLRSLRVPLRDRVASLRFYRAEVADRHEKMRIRRTPLGLFPAADPMAHVPSSWASESTPPDGCTIVNIKKDFTNGPAGTRFDIVITGDGFASDDLQPDEQYGGASKFDYHEAQVRHYLATIEPFLSLSNLNLINWHVVVAESAQSGITRCPDENSGSKITYYGFEGCWNGTRLGGFLGTPYPERIKAAAGRVADWEQIDLVIVIANCDQYGGHAWPDLKCAVVPTSPTLRASGWWVPSSEDPTYFNQLAAHEVGHVVARLAEERIVCKPEDWFRPDPNKAHLPEVAASVKAQLLKPDPTWVPLPGVALAWECLREHCLDVRLRGWPAVDSVWWKGLAHRRELTSEGLYKGVATPLSGPAPGTETYLGAYWGCQDTHSCEDLAELLVALTDSAATPQSGPGSSVDLLQVSPGLLGRMVQSDGGCDAEADIRGAWYYRAMAECRMRYIDAEFCRVCKHLIANVVKGICGEPVTPPLPPWVPW